MSLSLTVALLAAVASIMPMSSAETATTETPTAVVERLLEASAKEDWPAALAMLTADAQFGMGDVGGPLDKETVSLLNVLGKYGCRITSTHETPQRDPVRSKLRFVDVKRTCPYGAESGRSGEHELVVTYFIEGTQIAGFYLDIKSAPAAPVVE